MYSLPHQRCSSVPLLKINCLPVGGGCAPEGVPGHTGGGADGGGGGRGGRLAQVAALIRSATTSMTSVPKPLKFLMPHYPAIKVRL